MRVRVAEGEGGLVASLHDRDDLGSLSVELGEGVSVAPGAATLGESLRFVTAEQAWVDQAWLRRAGGFVEGSASLAEFEAMLAAAARHGWLDARTGAIAAHVE